MFDNDMPLNRNSTLSFLFFCRISKVVKHITDISDMDCENLRFNFLKRKMFSSKEFERKGFSSVQSKRNIKA